MRIRHKRGEAPQVFLQSVCVNWRETLDVVFGGQMNARSLRRKDGHKVGPIPFLDYSCPDLRATKKRKNTYAVVLRPPGDVILVRLRDP